MQNWATPAVNVPLQATSALCHLVLLAAGIKILRRRHLHLRTGFFNTSHSQFRLPTPMDSLMTMWLLYCAFEVIFAISQVTPLQNIPLALQLIYLFKIWSFSAGLICFGAGMCATLPPEHTWRCSLLLTGLTRTLTPRISFAFYIYLVVLVPWPLIQLVIIIMGILGQGQLWIIIQFFSYTLVLMIGTAMATVSGLFFYRIMKCHVLRHNLSCAASVTADCGSLASSAMPTIDGLLAQIEEHASVERIKKLTLAITATGTFFALVNMVTAVLWLLQADLTAWNIVGSAVFIVGSVFGIGGTWLVLSRITYYTIRSLVEETFDVSLSRSTIQLPLGTPRPPSQTLVEKSSRQGLTV